MKLTAGALAACYCRLVQERRGATRYDCEINLLIQPDGEAEPINGTTIDLSFLGLCAAVDRPIDRSAAVQIALWVESDLGSPAPIRLHAEVAWCTRTEGRFQIGFRFRLDKSAVGVARLEALLQSLHVLRSAGLRETR